MNKDGAKKWVQGVKWDSADVRVAEAEHWLNSGSSLGLHKMHWDASNQVNQVYSEKLLAAAGQVKWRKIKQCKKK